MAVIHPDIALPAAPVRQNRARRYVRRHPTIVVGGALLLIMIVMAIFAPWLGTVDPQALAPVRRLKWPSAAYWFGTDMLGRDVYSRTIYGARVSLIVGISVAVLATSLGLLIGVVAGFTRWVDAIVMRIMDGLMSIPSVLIAIALMALTRASMENVIFAITVADVPRVTGKKPRVVSERYGNVRGLADLHGTGEATWSDADQRNGHSVELNDLARDPGIASESVCPVPVRDHRHGHRR